MQLAILSGGSGERLWPLSNDARSKQFLPLLQKRDGSFESMLQRVFGQICEMKLAENVLIATNLSQRDNIVNQLGDNIDIVLEPQRRKTFPAVALISSYLYDVKHCSPDEVVVIMPCDVYTEQKYFETLHKMEEVIKAGEANLVLMGIQPAYPSTKYGYIIPFEGSPREEVVRVKQFVEKPDRETAFDFLKMGAFWNGGVFAFRLSYMLPLIEKYAGSTSFKDVVDNYSNFPKISFDYEIAENESSLAVIPFWGEWKDMGNWNSLTARFKRNSMGNVVMGKYNSNTHVINQLGIPVYVEGLRDVVVVASYDGILVSTKDKSDNVKGCVKELVRRPMYEERRWGSYRVIDDVTYESGARSLTKSIVVKAGKSISYQIHHSRSEIWTFVDGEGIFVLDGVARKVSHGDVVNIPKEHFHAVKAITDLTFIEVQAGNPLEEEDIERFDFDWDKVVVE